MNTPIWSGTAPACFSCERPAGSPNPACSGCECICHGVPASAVDFTRLRAELEAAREEAAGRYPKPRTPEEAPDA